VLLVPEEPPRDELPPPPWLPPVAARPPEPALEPPFPPFVLELPEQPTPGRSSVKAEQMQKMVLVVNNSAAITPNIVTTW
jgi:hypothetical protein